MANKNLGKSQSTDHQIVANDIELPSLTLMNLFDVSYGTHRRGSQDRGPDRRRASAEEEGSGCEAPQEMPRSERLQHLHLPSAQVGQQREAASWHLPEGHGDHELDRRRHLRQPDV